MVGTADTVLIREVSHIQSVLYREVPLYCMPYANVRTHIQTVLLLVDNTEAHACSESVHYVCRWYVCIWHVD